MELIADQIKDAIMKLEGGINMLIDGKQIQAFRRFEGVKHKLLALRESIILEQSPGDKD